MDSSIWIALIGIIGTLVGVWLGSFLQNSNVKRQREWDLVDWKNEWIRKQKQEMYKKILEFVEGSLLYIHQGKFIFNFGTEEQKSELFLKYQEKSTHATTLVLDMLNDDKELTDLVNKFISGFEGTDKIIEAGDIKISEKEQFLYGIAANIKQRITKLLEKTFD